MCCGATITVTYSKVLRTHIQKQRQVGGTTKRQLCLNKAHTPNTTRENIQKASNKRQAEKRKPKKEKQRQTVKTQTTKQKSMSVKLNKPEENTSRKQDRGNR